MSQSRDIYVVKLVTDKELLLNVGRATHHVVVNEVFEILDPNTQDVTDPITGKVLGSVDRVLAKVAVTNVGDQMSLARVTSRRVSPLSGVSQVMAGEPTVTLNPSRWPEGIEATFPARATGQVLIEPER